MVGNMVGNVFNVFGNMFENRQPQTHRRPPPTPTFIMPRSYDTRSQAGTFNSSSETPLCPSVSHNFKLRTPHHLVHNGDALWISMQQMLVLVWYHMKPIELMAGTIITSTLHAIHNTVSTHTKYRYLWSVGEACYTTSIASLATLKLYKMAGRMLWNGRKDSVHRQHPNYQLHTPKWKIARCSLRCLSQLYRHSY